MNLDDKKKELENKLCSAFSIVLKNLIKEKKKDEFETEAQTNSKIARELGITYQALVNYQNGRIPEYKQLAYIKDYFDVSYSYLFGETKYKDLKSQNFNFDLSGSALSKLERLGNQSKKSNYNSMAINNMIENLILEKNNTTLKLMAYLIISGKVENDKDKIDYIKFRLLNSLINQLNEISKEIDLPNEILIPTYESLKQELDK